MQLGRVWHAQGHHSGKCESASTSVKCIISVSLGRNSWDSHARVDSDPVIMLLQSKSTK